MHTSKLHYLFGIVILCLSVLPQQSQAATKNKHQTEASAKERLVLMPLRVPDEDKNLTGAMETALVEGLQQKYDVFSGEQVSQKARQIFLKESRNSAHTECDETRCMQNIAEAFQAELIATANVSKQDGSYFLALSIQNIFDSKVVYSKSLPCESCKPVRVVEKLKELSGLVGVASTAPNESDAQLDLADKYFKGEGVTKDYARVLEIVNPLANQGNTRAMNRLGTLYTHGLGVPKNYAKALELLQKSADKGYAGAQSNLGDAYFSGNGVLKNFAKAAKWYQKAADQGIAVAQNNLGILYFDGNGVPKNFAKAAEWYQKAADQGLDVAQLNLGGMYYKGDGVPMNFAKAAEWTQKAADQGNINAQAALGDLYLDGNGVPKDDTKAAEWYQKAAEQGNDYAKNQLKALGR